MDHTNCPHYQRAETDRAEFARLVGELRQEIEANMRALGLKPERMSAQVRSAAMIGARAEMLSLQAAVVPATYTEVSREGNEKPVTHPIYIQATSTATAYANALKMLGIYASTEKVATRAQDKVDDQSPLASLMSEMGNYEVD